MPAIKKRKYNVMKTLRQEKTLVSPIYFVPEFLILDKSTIQVKGKFKKLPSKNTLFNGCKCRLHYLEVVLIELFIIYLLRSVFTYNGFFETLIPII